MVRIAAATLCLFCYSCFLGNPCGTCPEEGVPLFVPLAISNATAEPVQYAQAASCTTVATCVEIEESYLLSLHQALCQGAGGTSATQKCSVTGAVGFCVLSPTKGRMRKVYGAAWTPAAAASDCAGLSGGAFQAP